jgi:hypothetical membrane protein
MKPGAVESIGRHAGWLAALCVVAAALGFGAVLEGYSQAQHPLALLGARGVPRALAFNLTVFVMPGLLASLAAIALRVRLPGDAGWLARIGAQLLLLSALAFAAQGLLPLDPDDLDGPVSRWHATAWTLWWIASAAGAASIAGGLWRRRGWRMFAWAALIASALVAGFSLSPSGAWPAGIAPRIALGAWLALFVLGGRAGAPRGFR